MWLSVFILFLVPLSATATEELAEDKIMEELQTGNGTKIYDYDLKTKEGTTYNEKVLVDRAQFKKLVVSTKDGKDTQMFYEDCEENVEYIASAKDPHICYVHKLTEDERLRNCVEKPEFIYKTNGKAAKDMKKKIVAESVIVDSYTEGDTVTISLKTPLICKNRKLVTLVPELIGKTGNTEDPDSETMDTRGTAQKYCCCNRDETEEYCCRTCHQDGWWGLRRTWCCGGKCKRVRTVRRCGYQNRSYCVC